MFGKLLHLLCVSLGIGFQYEMYFLVGVRGHENKCQYCMLVLEWGWAEGSTELSPSARVTSRSFTQKVTFEPGFEPWAGVSPLKNKGKHCREREQYVWKHRGMKQQREELDDQWACGARNGGRGGWRVRESWIPKDLDGQRKCLSFMTLCGATVEKAGKWHDQREHSERPHQQDWGREEPVGDWLLCGEWK